MTDPIQQDFFEAIDRRPPAPGSSSSTSPSQGPESVSSVQSTPAPSRDRDVWQIDGHPVVIQYIRHPRSRRLRLTWKRDGSARCTLPMRGSMVEARRFVEKNIGWLVERVKQSRATPATTGGWTLGTRILFKGVETPIEADIKPGHLRLNDFVFRGPLSPGVDLRNHVRHALRWHAASELPLRVLELAGQFGFPVKRISVRDQRTRWGSCSARNTISLNWRLIQTPAFVVDYIILHELAHTRHMNHSDRFWDEVARVCPNYPEAEAWLKTFGRQLL